MNLSKSFSGRKFVFGKVTNMLAIRMEMVSNGRIFQIYLDEVKYPPTKRNLIRFAKKLVKKEKNS